jgi:F-type H+-transporting ATPase subunit b
MKTILLLCLAAQSLEGGQVSDIAESFGVDWLHLGAQIISFSLLCAVLYKFAYRKVLAMLEERRRLIELGLANAETIKAELQKTEEQRKEVMAHAYEEYARIVEEARTAGTRLLEEETRKATISAEEITAKARETADLDRERMLAELKRDVGRWAVKAAAAVTGKILTTEDQRRLAEENVQQLAA